MVCDPAENRLGRHGDVAFLVALAKRLKAAEKLGERSSPNSGDVASLDGLMVWRRIAANGEWGSEWPRLDDSERQLEAARCAARDFSQH
jgi:hypothetical protein